MKPDIKHVPNHVAIIMDGNGRWARERDLPRLAGHRAGTQNIRPIADCLLDYGTKYLTLYAFSTENWSRPKAEVEGLMTILEESIERELLTIREEGVRLLHLGRLGELPDVVRKKIEHALELTKDNTRGTLCLALNYGGRAEIVDAVRRIVKDGIPPQDIDEALLSSYLYTAGLPDPDLVIRTGSEMRLSNFLIWQTAYSEYYSTPTLWPDLGPEDIVQALTAYSERDRRFGGLK